MVVASGWWKDGHGQMGNANAKLTWTLRYCTWKASMRLTTVRYTARICWCCCGLYFEGCAHIFFALSDLRAVPRVIVFCCFSGGCLSLRTSSGKSSSSSSSRRRKRRRNYISTNRSSIISGTNVCIMSYSDSSSTNRPFSWNSTTILTLAWQKSTTQRRLLFTHIIAPLVKSKNTKTNEKLSPNQYTYSNYCGDLSLVLNRTKYKKHGGEGGAVPVWFSFFHLWTFDLPRLHATQL